MGAWGASLYSDDTTCEVRDAYVDNLRRGLSDREACERILRRYGDLLGQHEIACLVYFALADTAWKYGRLDEGVRRRALELIGAGADIEVWQRDSPDSVAARTRAIRSLERRLNSAQPALKRIKIKRPTGPLANAQVGAVFTLKLPGGGNTALVLVGFADDEPAFSVLHWRGASLPTHAELVEAAGRCLVFPSESGQREHISFYVVNKRTGLRGLRRTDLSLPRLPTFDAGSILLIDLPVVAMEIDEQFDRAL